MYFLSVNTVNNCLLAVLGRRQKSLNAALAVVVVVAGIALTRAVAPGIGQSLLVLYCQGFPSRRLCCQRFGILKVWRRGNLN